MVTQTYEYDKFMDFYFSQNKDIKNFSREKKTSIATSDYYFGMCIMLSNL